MNTLGGSYLGLSLLIPIFIVITCISIISVCFWGIRALKVYIDKNTRNFK